MAVTFNYVYYGDKAEAGGHTHAFGMCGYTTEPSDIAPRGPEHWDWPECGQCLNKAEKLGLEVEITKAQAPKACTCNLYHAGECF